jgi:hypothetical protein
MWKKDVKETIHQASINTVAMFKLNSMTLKLHSVNVLSSIVDMVLKRSDLLPC